MWLGLCAATSGFTLLILLRALKKFRGDPLTQFLLLVIWARYVLSAFHEWTFSPVAAGFSLNAISSVLVAVIGLICMPIAYFRVAGLGALYALLFVIALSGLINGEIEGILNDFTKWMYFMTIFLLLYRAIGIYGSEVVLRGVLICLTTPLLLQVASVILGYQKEAPDGSISFIGGYLHEAVFSIILLTAMWLVTIISWRRSVVGPLLVAAIFFGIVLTNYRTTAIAALPILFIYFFGRTTNQDPAEFRKLVRVPLLAASAYLIFVFGGAIQQRFSDLLVLLSVPGEFLKEPELYTYDQQDLFSSRLYFWAHYIEAFMNGDVVQKLIGFGPEAYEGTMPKHAHNTFVSFLYEVGLIGLAVLIFWYAQNFVAASRARDPLMKSYGIAGHFAFLLMNLATLPLWQIEGLIFYALLVACASKAEAGGRDKRNVEVPA